MEPKPSEFPRNEQVERSEPTPEATEQREQTLELMSTQEAQGELSRIAKEAEDKGNEERKDFDVSRKSLESIAQKYDVALDPEAARESAAIGTQAEEATKKFKDDIGEALKPEATAIEPAAKEEKSEAGIEKKEKEAILRTFEYRDSEGRLLGSAEIALDTEEKELDEMTVGKKEKGRGRALKSFMLRGEKDGKPTAVDVMAMINPHGAEIIVASSRLDNYSYNDNNNRATVPMPETPLDIGVVMHELGHTDQHHEDRFAPVSPLYADGNSAKADAQGSLPDVKKKIEQVIAAVPEAAKMVNQETMSELEALHEEKGRLWEKRDAIQDRLDERRGEKNRLIQEMLGRAVTAALPEGFAADVERTFNALSEEWDENTWNAKTAEYVATLERAGFRLAAETAPPESEKKKPLRRFVRFDDDEADEKKAVAPLSRGELNGVDVVRGVATRFNRGVDADTTAITYSKETGTLKAEVPFGSGGFWNRRLDLELPMSETDHSAYVAAKEAADAAVTEEERELAETTEALAALERQQKERVAKSNIADIIKLPMRMLERDATRRAYQWMRKLKQEAGVDLFAAHMAHAETTLPGIREARKSTVENCESSTEEALEPGNESLVETDVIENLDIGLQSYGAEHPPLKKRGS